MIEKKVSVMHLKTGMYISNLDRPWKETPFLFQGFYVNGSAEMDELKKHCNFVFIDVERGIDADEYLSDDDAEEKEIQSAKVEKELPQAKLIYTKIRDELMKIMEDAKAGKQLKITPLEKDVFTLVEGYLRNTDAYLLLTKLKTRDDYTYTHSLSASVFAVMLGKELGLKREDLQELAIATMFFDIGKVKLPREILLKAEPLNTDESALIKEHVLHSVKLLESAEGVKRSVIDVALNHHERYDGNGYPSGKKNDDIPLFARIAGIVDTYDAMTSERVYSKLYTHEQTIKQLYQRRNIDFQDDLLEQFIRCLGIYPTGSLIELSTGEVGVVLQQNSIRRLKPRVMIILNRKKKFNNYFPIIDLMTESEDQDGNLMEIRHTLEPGTYGINPAEYYL
jgi:HD-GYP domain-containing protein (c-di-GMP phosphodiesterase class II)